MMSYLFLFVPLYCFYVILFVVVICSIGLMLFLLLSSVCLIKMTLLAHTGSNDCIYLSFLMPREFIDSMKLL